MNSFNATVLSIPFHLSSPLFKASSLGIAGVTIPTGYLRLPNSNKPLLFNFNMLGPFKYTFNRIPSDVKRLEYVTPNERTQLVITAQISDCTMPVTIGDIKNLRFQLPKFISLDEVEGATYYGTAASS